jgi:hypothetical protein
MDDYTLTSEANRLYWYDSTFHAIVDEAVALVEVQQHGLSARERDVALNAAAVTLLVKRRRWPDD